MSDYRTRVIDKELTELLIGVPAVSIEGPRAVGKTSTAMRQATTVHRLDDERARAVLLADPSLVIQGRPPILIDEWQRMPSSWDLVRRAVDEDRDPGRFLLTGSAFPTDAPPAGRAYRLFTASDESSSVLSMFDGQP
jgi:predicted AAA+ superfamily ATPase